MENCFCVCNSVQMLAGIYRTNGLQGGDVTMTYLWSIAVSSVLLQHETGGNTWQRTSVHTVGHHFADILLPSPSRLASVAWTCNVEVTSYMYVFTSEKAIAQRRTSGVPCRSGYSDMSISDSFRVGFGPYSQLPQMSIFSLKGLSGEI
jgi:hypothetical protein